MAHPETIGRLNQANVSVSRDIWALFQRAYRIEAKIVGVENFPPLSRTTEDIRTTKSTFTGLFEGSALKAVAQTQITRNCLSIDGFVVDPGCFRTGSGSRLLQYVLDDSHCDTAYVETAAANEPALRFYGKFGFMEMDRWEVAEGMQLVKLGVNL